jgi:error-prone DNA polymerase
VSGDQQRPPTRGEKGRPVYGLDEVITELRGHTVALTGCRKGAVRRALVSEGADAAYGEVYR